MNTLLACERARADEVMAGDLDRLADWLAEDLVYVHATGLRHDKAQLLAYLRTGPRFLAIDLLNPSVQVMSDCALVVGELEMRLQRNPEEQPVGVVLWPLISSRGVRPVISQTFALGQAQEAHRAMEEGHHIGKIVLTTASSLT